ncbi:MAG TPA: PqqD family protein [Vicinamibacterales bacterium]|nr:PqqD family protein [Vicinamibacterales bacterium]
MPDIRQSRVRLAPDVVLQVIGDEALLLKLDDETVFALNRVGARVAECIQSEVAVAEIVAELGGEFDADMLEIEQDVVSLVEELEARRLVVLFEGTDAAS